MKRKIEKGTIIRTVVLAVALANQGLIMTGKNPIPYSSEEIGEAVAMILTVSAALLSWWKNNSFTQAAITADESLKQSKGE